MTPAMARLCELAKRLAYAKRRMDLAAERARVLATIADANRGRQPA